MDSSVEIFVDEGDRAIIRGRTYEVRGLKEHLWKLAEVRRDPDHPSGANPSKIVVLLVAASERPWFEVETVLQVCADPDVRIYRVYWLARTPEGALSVLPVPTPVGHPGGRSVEVDLLRDDGEGSTRVLVNGRDLGKRGVAALREGRPKEDVAYPGVVAVSPSVPFGEVAETVDALRGLGVEEVVFTVP
jgi:hypothetical protein